MSPPKESAGAPSISKKNARRILKEAAERAGRKIRLAASDALFAPQQAFVEDKSLLKVACCSRRAGKSYAIAYALLAAGFKYPGSFPVYITMSRSDSKNILWPALADLDQKHNLGLSFKENSGEVALPNGSRILVRGGGSRREIDKLRGPKYPCAVVDEAQGFGSNLLYLIDEVLEPATLDYSGWISVTGTPNAACAGPFFDMATRPELGWSVHKWTLLDNPHIPHAADWLAKMKDRRGWDTAHPSYRREYKGEWVRDAEGLVFRYDESIHLIREFPREAANDWQYVLGIDLGYNDPTAFVVQAYSAATGRVVVVESHKESGLIPSAAAAEVEKYMARYPFVSIVADTGGFGKGYAEEWKQKYRIPVVAAQKTEKLGYIQMLNGDLSTGAMRIVGPSNRALAEEMSLLQWDSDKILDNRWVADDKFEDHLCDALLYGWRECKHHVNEWQVNAPKHGTKDYWRDLEDKMMDDAIKANSESDQPWWMAL